MATIQHSPFFYSSKPIMNAFPSTKQQFPKCTPYNTLKVFSSSGPSSAAESSSPNSEETSGPAETDPVRLAFARAKAYKKAIPVDSTPQIVEDPVGESAELDEKIAGSESEIEEDENQEEIPSGVKLSVERAKEYKKGKDIAGGNAIGGGTVKTLGLDGDKGGSNITAFSKKKVNKTDALTVSSIDFVGLEFADKKKGRGLPAGLVPVSDPFPEGDLTEVEIIVGDTSRFGDAAAAEPQLTQEDGSILYKPKVSTWGVFPRPNNISKTFGGGRNLQPGEELETAEEKAAKEARTRQLLAAYKNKIGLIIHPKLKSECEKALEDGDSLMDIGKLKDALPFYEKVMDKLAFQTELHGLAALQWCICQDSLSRSNEARAMYEKLQSHPNVQVSKKASQFVFSFQAMEMMKVTSSARSPQTTGYQNYFDAFVKDMGNLSLKQAETDEGALGQSFPYILILFSPILLVLFMAVQKGR